MIRILLLSLLLLLPACKTIPTSALLNLVRGERESTLAVDVQQRTQSQVKLGTNLYLRVFKEERVLEAWLRNPKTKRYVLYKTYDICNYSGHLGPKLAEGDLQAPEGFYLVAPEQMNPNSQFHLALNVGYPNAYDRAHGRTGSHLMIHGGCKSTGCYAMTDQGIEEIYLLADSALRKGQNLINVHIFPFRMSDENMTKHRKSHWYPFWTNLKAGYDVFEATQIPPLVGMNEQKQYVFYNRSVLNLAAAAHTTPVQTAQALQAPARPPKPY